MIYPGLCKTRMPQKIQKLEEPEELVEPLSRPTSWDELRASLSYSAEPYRDSDLDGRRMM